MRETERERKRQREAEAHRGQVVKTLDFYMEDHRVKSRTDLLLENYMYLCPPRNDGYLVER